MYTTNHNPNNTRHRKEPVDNQNRMAGFKTEEKMRIEARMSSFLPFLPTDRKSEMELFRREMIHLYAEQFTRKAHADTEEWKRDLAKKNQADLDWNVKHGLAFTHFCSFGNSCKSPNCFNFHTGPTAGMPWEYNYVVRFDMRGSSQLPVGHKDYMHSGAARVAAKATRPINTSRVQDTPTSTDGMGYYPALGDGVAAGATPVATSTAWADMCEDEPEIEPEIEPQVQAVMDLSAETAAHDETKRALETMKKELEGLQESLQTAHKQNVKLVEELATNKIDMADQIATLDRLVAAEKKLAELAAKPVEVVEVEKIVEKPVYCEVVKVVYVEKTVEATVEMDCYVDHIYDGWHQLLSKVPKLVRAANVKAAGVEHVKFIKSKNARERFATLAQATVEVGRLRVMNTLKERFAIKKAMLEKAEAEKAEREKFVATFVEGVLANVVRGFAEAEAATKIQAAVKAHEARKVHVKVETDSDIETMSFRPHGSANLFKETERNAAQNPQPVTLTAALLARANEQAPGNALLIELIQLVTQLNETVTDYARRLEILEAARTTGNSQ